MPVTTKDYLGQVFHLRGEIVRMEEERYKLETQTMRTTNMSPNKTQVSLANNMEDMMIAIADYSRGISKATRELYNLQFEISSQISRMKNLKHRQLLRLRYTMELSWEQIAEDMGYDVRWVHRLHGYALQEFAEVSHIKP